MRDPTKRIPRWEAETACERAETCIIFLAIHGLLSDAEKRKVRGRLQSFVDKWNAKQLAAPPTPGRGERG